VMDWPTAFVIVGVAVCAVVVLLAEHRRTR
jgi:hypothetical protein